MKAYLQPGPTCENNPDILRIIKRTNEAMNSDEFHRRLCQRRENFLHSNINGPQLSRIIKYTEITMTVNLYRSKNPWTSSNGYYDPNRPRDIFLNTRKLLRFDGEIGGTMAHEYVHAEDAYQPFVFFHHGKGIFANKWTPEKENCAQFYVDNIIEEMLDGTRSPEKMATKINAFSWWRPWTWFK